MQKLAVTLGLILLAGGLALGQGYSQKETVYPIVDALRKQVIKDQQKYYNVYLSKDAYVPVILNGNIAYMDTLHTIQLKDVRSVSLDFEFNDLPLGSQKDYGVIVIKMREEKEG